MDQKKQLFKIEFASRDQTFSIRVWNLDMSHVHFVYVSDFEWQSQSNMLHIPGEDETRERFRDCKGMYIPVMSISLIEKIDPETYLAQRPMPQLISGD